VYQVTQTANQTNFQMLAFALIALLVAQIAQVLVLAVIVVQVPL